MPGGKWQVAGDPPRDRLKIIGLLESFFSRKTSRIDMSLTSFHPLNLEGTFDLTHSLDVSHRMGWLGSCWGPTGVTVLPFVAPREWAQSPYVSFQNPNWKCQDSNPRPQRLHQRTPRIWRSTTIKEGAFRMMMMKSRRTLTLGNETLSLLNFRHSCWEPWDVKSLVTNRKHGWLLSVIMMNWGPRAVMDCEHALNWNLVHS